MVLYEEELSKEEILDEDEREELEVVSSITRQKDKIKVDGKKKLRIAIYCRVSTASKSQAKSLKNQRDGLVELVKSNPKWKLAGIYSDRGKTGTNMERDEFKKLMRDCGVDSTTWQIIGESKIDMIVCKNTSRFARNVRGMSSAIEVLAKNDVYIFFLDLGKSTAETDDLMGIHMISIFDAQESISKSKKVLYGFEMSAARNTVRSNGRLFGYTYTREHKLIQNEDSVTVRYIFEQYLKGKGCRVIAQDLNNNPAYNPSGKKWGSSSIKKLLSNEKYAGLNNPLKWTSGSITKDKHSPRQQEAYKIKPCPDIEAIVSVDEFYKCQYINKKKVEKYNTDKGQGLKIGCSKYGGRITCGKCGSRYNHNIDINKRTKEKTEYYNCHGKKSKGLSYCDAPNLDDLIITNLLTITTKKYNDINYLYVYNYLADCIDVLIEYYSSGHSSAEINKIQMHKEELNKKLSNLMGMVEDLGFASLTSVERDRIKSLKLEILKSDKEIELLKEESVSSGLINWLKGIKEYLSTEEFIAFANTNDSNLYNRASRIVLYTSPEFKAPHHFFKKYREDPAKYINPFRQVKEGPQGIWIELEFDGYLNLFDSLDDIKNGYYLDRFNCCRIFTRYKTPEDAERWFKKHADKDGRVPKEKIREFLETDRDIWKL